MSLTQEMETTPMETRQLHSSQKEAIKKIAEFSGEANELDIDEWLYDLTNLFSVMKLKDEARILETMGKLTGPALRWYQENLKSFTSWNEAETALRDRFQEFTSNSQLMQEFFNIRQEENQSVIAFYENAIRQYRKSRQCITEQQVITVLQTGVKDSLKEYLIRNEQEINKPEIWLKYAREEECIQKRIHQQRNNLHPEIKEKPFFQPMLSTVTTQSISSNRQPPNVQIIKPWHYHKKQSQHSSQTINHQFIQQNHQQGMRQYRAKHSTTKPHETDTCLICNKKNHRTKQCYYKKDNGCFKCGQSNHQIRDCPNRKHHFFK